MEEFEDPVWKVLGKARTAKASPFFARKVLRAVRGDRKPAGSLGDILRWIIPFGATAALALALGGTFFSSLESGSFAVNDDNFSQMADLSSLVTQEDTSAWVGDLSP